MIEVQFHTPTSWEVNMTTHDAYEELAHPDTTSARRRELLAWREHQTATIPVPPGAQEIADHGRATMSQRDRPPEPTGTL